MTAVIVEDDTMFRELIRKICVRECRLTILGECSSEDDSVNAIRHLAPALVIVDLELESGTGFGVIRRAGSLSRRTNFIVLTCHSEEYTTLEVERTKVSAYLHKGTDMVSSLTSAIEAVRNGGTYYSQTYQNSRITNLSNPMAFTKLLTDTEQIVAGLIGRGCDDGQVAAMLGISFRSAQNYRYHIADKLGLDSVQQLCAFGRRSGLATFAEYLVRRRKPLLEHLIAK